MNVKSVVKYIAYGLLFCFVQYAEGKLRIKGAGLALFFALVYLKQNMFVLCPVYLATALLAGFTWQNAVIGAVPVATALTAILVHYKLKKPIKFFELFIYALIGCVPRAILDVGIYSIISIAFAEAEIYAFVLGIKAVVHKGLRFRLTFEEKLSFTLLFMILGGSLCAIKIAWFTPFYCIVMVPALLTYRYSGMVAPVILTGMGLGAALFGEELVPAAVATCSAAACALLKREKLLYAVPTILAVTVIALVYFEGSEFFWGEAIPIAAVAVVEAGLLLKFGDRLERFDVCFAEGNVERSVINRGRRNLSARLLNLSTVFSDTGDMLTVQGKAFELRDAVNEMTEGVNKLCCGSCETCKNCEDTMGKPRRMALIADLVDAAVKKGRASILETPPFLSANCSRINRMIAAVNEVVAVYMRRCDEQKVVENEREIVGMQMHGVGKLIRSMALDFDKHLDFDRIKESALAEELTYEGIGSSDVVVYGSDGGREAVLLVKQSDADNPKLLTAASRAFGRKMEIITKERALGGALAITIAESPGYTVLYAEKHLSAGVGEVKDGACGDKIYAAAIACGKVMLVLSDGMGCGIQASQNSSGCVALLENLYKAGFDMETVVGFVGKLLKVRQKDDFNALDVGILDTQTGDLDFVKLGGRESFLVDSDGVKLVECGSLPIGALDEPEPLVRRYSLGDDTVIVMVSDGIIDVIGEESLATLVEGFHGTNPDVVADAVMENFLHIAGDSPHDDASVLVARAVKVRQ